MVGGGPDLVGSTMVGGGSRAVSGQRSCLTRRTLPACFFPCLALMVLFCQLVYS